MDLARSLAGERMPEAGPRRPSRGTSGGPSGSSLRKWKLSGGTCRRKALRIRKRRRWCAACGSVLGSPSGPLRRRGLSKGATGSVSDFAIRLVQRTKTPTHELTPPEPKRRRPSGESRARHGWRVRHQPARCSRSEMPSRAIRRHPGASPSNPSTSTLGEGGEQRGDQAGEIQTLENGWIQRVLVDIKSVAEIGERHLVCLGSERFGERARVRRARAGRPITVTGGKPGACSKGASTVWSSTNQSL